MSRSTNFMIFFTPRKRCESHVFRRGQNIYNCDGLEKCYTLEPSFSSAINEINFVLEDGFIDVDGKQIREIKLSLGEDYKFQFMVTGLSSACSNSQWVSCGTCDRSAPLECKIIMVNTADITLAARI